MHLLTAAFMRIPLFQGSTGDGLAQLPMDASGSGSSYANGAMWSNADGSSSASKVGSSVADPVAERRRERALKALDKKLADLRTNHRPTGSGTLVVPGTASPAPSTAPVLV